VLKLDVLEIELENGLRSTREIIRHPGAVIVLPQLPDGRFVFVRQFRKAVDEEMLEVVAGTLNHGEDPAACAERELMEETGYRARRMIKLGRVVPAPGYTDEKLHTFFAELDPLHHEHVGDDDENITTEFLTAAQVEERIAAGHIEDAKTLATWQLYLTRLPRLR
jgi:ADP-ribose pyrophosphatase